MTPAELQALRAALPAFGDRAHPSRQLLDFCQFYQIDFSAHFPEAAYRAGLVNSGRYRLMLHRWLQPAPRCNLLLVHGYLDHAGLYGKLIAYGLSRACNVVIFDLPGHGLSSGEPAAIDDFADYAAAVSDALAAAGLPAQLPLRVVGQSTGCAALTELARGGTWPFAGAAFLAPLVHPAQWTLVRLAHALLRPFTDGVARRFNRNSSDEAFLDFVRRDPLQSRRIPFAWIGALQRWLARLPRTDLGVGPVLVVQGERDTTVDWRYNVRVVQQLFAGSETCYLPGAGHQLANESEAIRAVYCAALDQYFERHAGRA